MRYPLVPRGTYWYQWARRDLSFWLAVTYTGFIVVMILTGGELYLASLVAPLWIAARGEWRKWRETQARHLLDQDFYS